MAVGNIQIYFTTEDLSLLATRHAYRYECYSLNENDYKWNRYKGQPIIIARGFEVYYYGYYNWLSFISIPFIIIFI